MSTSRRGFLKAGGALVASLGSPVGEVSPAATPVPKAGSVAGRIPVLGTSRMHQQQNWMADWIDPAVAKGRALPWTLGADLSNGILAVSRNGAAPSQVQAWHVWGNPSELYSEVPWFDPQGRSHPYSAQTSDDFAAIVSDLEARPPTDGPRGLAMPVAQATVIPHPTYFPVADASMPKSPNTGVIPRHPLVIWVRHDGYIQFGYADGHVRGLGWIPDVFHVHDGCIDGRFMTDARARKRLYVCDLGVADAAGKWSGGRIALVDRLPGAEAVGGTPAEDPERYAVTTVVTAGYPTAVRSDETGALYFIDDDKPGQLMKIPAFGSPGILCTVPGAFALDYGNGKLYVACKSGAVHIVDATTGAVGPNLMPAQYLAAEFSRGTDFMTISVDANGTCGPVGTFMCSRVHTNGNTNTWQFAPDGATWKYGYNIYKSSQGWNTCGDARYVHEIFGHYDWIGGKYHMDQAVQFVGGYANTPVGVLVFDPPYPAQAAVDYTAVWRGMKNICRGGPVDDKSKPSLTCLMTREGWSPFAGCSNDEIAEMSFDAAQAWIQGGYAGAFPRPEIAGDDLYCVMLFHLVNSQRHIREGAPFIAAFQSWWRARFGPPPATPADVVDVFTADATTHLDPLKIPYRLEARETTPGQYRVGIFGSINMDTRYRGQDYSSDKSIGPVPDDAMIIADQGTAQEQQLPGPLASGWHALTVRAAGWATGAVAYAAVPAPPAAHVTPTIACLPALRATTAGTSVSVAVKVQNNDAAASASAFDVSAAVPTGWSASSARTAAIVPGGRAGVTLTLTAPAGTAPGPRAVTLRAANADDPTKFATTSMVVAVVSSLVVTARPSQTAYLPASGGTGYARITTRVTSGPSPVPGAKVAVTVRDPQGATTTFSGDCDVDGNAFSDVPLGPRGTYAVSARASLGAVTQSATTGFVVVVK